MLSCCLRQTTWKHGSLPRPTLWAHLRVFIPTEYRAIRVQFLRLYSNGSHCHQISVPQSIFGAWRIEAVLKVKVPVVTSKLYLINRPSRLVDYYQSAAARQFKVSSCACFSFCRSVNKTNQPSAIHRVHVMLRFHSDKHHHSRRPARFVQWRVHRNQAWVTVQPLSWCGRWPELCEDKLLIRLKFLNPYNAGIFCISFWSRVYLIKLKYICAKNKQKKYVWLKWSGPQHPPG